MSNDLYELLSEQVKEAASRASYKWHGLLDADDIEQELWVQILESPATARKLQGADTELLTDLLARMADRICIKERHSYERFSGQFRYSVSEVKTIATDILTKPGPVTEEVIDFMDALERLIVSNPDQAEVFLVRYADGKYPDKSSERMMLSRARVNMTDYMNRNRRERSAKVTDGPCTKPKIPAGYDPYSRG